MPDKNALYEDLSQDFQEEKNKLNEEIRRYNQFIETALQKLKKKKENPFENPEEIHYESFQIKHLIDELNKIISHHNKKTNNFKETRLKEKEVLEDTEEKEAKTEEIEKVFALLITPVQKEAVREREAKEEKTG